MGERDVFWQPESADPVTDPWHHARGVPPFRVENFSNDRSYRFKDGSGATYLLRPVAGNSAPAITSVAILPAAGPAGTVFLASVSASGSPAPSLAYRWTFDGDVVPGATAASFQSVAPGALSVEVTASNASGTATLTSAPATVTAPSAALMFEIDTRSPGGSLTQRLPFTGSHALAIDWGDGTIDAGVTEPVPAHDYAAHGRYTIAVTGQATAFTDFNSHGTQRNLIRIASFGGLGITDWSSGFWDCANLVAVPPTLPAGATIITDLFRNCTKLNDPVIEEWLPLDQPHFLNGLFMDASTLDQPVAHLLTRRVAGLNSFLRGARAFRRSLRGADTSRVRDFRHMLRDCVAFDGEGVAEMSLAATGGVWALNGFATGARFSTTNYDAVLVAWSRGVEQEGWRRTLHPDFGSSKYTPGGAAESARSALIAAGWSITDGGPAHG